VSVNADSEADAQQVVADILGREPAELVATARGLGQAGDRECTAAEGPTAIRRTQEASAANGEGARDNSRAKTVGAIIRRRRESRGISLARIRAAV